MGFDQALWDAYAQIFSTVIDMSNDMPAFATVDIATNYDNATRKLDVTVSGKVSPEDLATYVQDAALTVYLTEDNRLVSPFGCAVEEEQQRAEFEAQNPDGSYTRYPAVDYTGKTLEQFYNDVLLGV